MGWWEGLQIDTLLSKPMGSMLVKLRFTGVTTLRLDGFRPLDGLRILDATQFLPEIPHPVCVLHYKWAKNDDEPYFWAQSVELLSHD